jgi:phosphatidate cytidylyltransferase
VTARADLTWHVTRILSALVLIPSVVGIIWLAPAWATLVLALVVAALAFHELSRVAAAGAGSSATTLSAVATLAACAAIGRPGGAVDAPLLAAVVAVGAAAVARGRPDEDVVRRTAVAFFPVLYVGLPLGAAVRLRYEWGAAAVLALLATTVVSDTAQYYGGRLFGRRALAPSISPKKTIEGAISGLLVGGAVLPLLGPWALPDVDVRLLALAGPALVGFGILGDLFESLIKRSAGVKDSSALIPGHGGVLDRIDSVLFAAPFYYLFLRAAA